MRVSSAGGRPSLVIKLWAWGAFLLQGLPLSIISTLRNDRPKAIAAESPA